MQSILLIGIPASGKSTFFQERFADSHVRVNRDMLGTAYRHEQLMKTCVEAGIRFVSDNTNVTREVRSRTIDPAKEAGFEVVGYYFESNSVKSIILNSQRDETYRVPDVAIYSKRSCLEYPSLSEGFDQLYFVKLCENGFDVSVWEG